MPDERLEDALERGGVEPALRDRLAKFGRLVLDANRQFNVTGASSESALAEHLLDSLTILPYIQEPYADVGSGAGLPAIVVALAAQMPVTMIESNLKKARLLETLIDQLELFGTVVPDRAESAGHDPKLREHFASVTARGVAVAPAVAELVAPLMRRGGLGVLQRGAMPEREKMALTDASLMLGAAIEGEVRLGGERRIVLLRKVALTPERFPRRSGLPAKRPLCL